MIQISKDTESNEIQVEYFILKLFLILSKELLDSILQKTNRIKMLDEIVSIDLCGVALYMNMH